MLNNIVVLCGAATAIAFAASHVEAADLPARQISAAEIAPAPTFTWTGFYVGANAGYAFDAGQRSQITGEGGLQINIVDGIRPGRGRLLSDGFTGGGQIGYNLQLGSVPLFGPTRVGQGVVVGIEADASYTSVKDTGSYFSNRLSSFSSRTPFVGTARGRLGYAFGPVLIYGTGGLAYGDVRSISAFYGPPGDLNYLGTAGQLRTGVAYGGGVEFAIPTTSILNLARANAVTVKAEFIRYDLGSYGLRIGNLFGQPAGYDQTIHASGDIVRVGINYKFGASPVVARY